MKIPTIAKDYARLSDSKLSQKTQAIIGALNGNDYFPETNPSMEAIADFAEDFTTALNKCVTGDRVAIALKNQKREVLLENLRLLANNIEFLAQGDEVKLLSSGFTLTADGDNPQTVGAPKGYKLLDGLNTGEVKSIVSGAMNAVSYLHEYTEGPLSENSHWVSKASSSREHVFTGLKSGMRIYARVAVIGRKGQEVYTDILTRMVQ